ncbi:O-methyltransferase-domain-containing protein [Rhexocercosporidium sp. MPI-PUGE-AT-0058]|nr:O-methyltransferase-domain-containing protein [Rhexocercosporidium sp. MPI-PUGE-AT-0058]
MPAHIFPAETYAKFNAVDDWISSSLLKPDKALTSTLQTNATSNLDAIDVNPNEGKFLHLLARINNSKRILEIGTLGGYSAIWFAKAVGKDGTVVTLEVDQRHADVARGNISRANFSDVVEVKVGAALTTLAAMEANGTEPFDMVFIDADKENNVGYFEYALKFSRVGTVIVVDNVVRQGRVLRVDGETMDETQERARKGVWDVFGRIGGERRVEATALQTVGPKGWDGFAVALVVE